MAKEESAGNWSRSHKLIKFDVAGDVKIPKAASVSHSLMPQMLFCKYYEGFGNTFMVKITCVDTNGLLDKLPIRTGMSVELAFAHASLEKDEVFEFSQANNNNLIIVNIDNTTHAVKRQMFTLTCITPTTLSNHTTRVSNKYIGRISTTVETILTKILEVDKSRQNVEATSNKYDFCGNFTRPVNLINRLATKSISASDAMGEGENKDNKDNKKKKGISESRGLCGFMFFETQKSGYNFRSIRDMLKEESEFPVYTKVGAKDAMNSNPFQLVATPKFTESQDLIKKLRAGQYQSHNVVYDIMNRTVKSFIYKSHTDGEIASTVDETPSRRMLTVLDLGLTSPKDDEEYEDLKKKQIETVTWRQAHTAAQYQLLYSQMLNVTIPMNLNLEVGMTLNFKFPDINTGDDTSDGVTPSSGKYLIARLSHEFGNPVGDYTGLTLVREHYLPYEE
tara:strand:- start:1603 stop:2949 length:1347 start_codon:yes stop_codon:yes gene_type:complete